MTGDTPSLIRRFNAIDPLVLDGCLALFLFFGSVMWAELEPDRASRAPDGLAVLLSAVVNLPLVLRRRAPLAVLVVSTGAALTFHLLGYHYGGNLMGPLLALYTVTVHRPTSWSVAGAVLVAGQWSYAAAHNPGSTWWSALGQAAVVVGVATGIGIGTRLLGERTRQLTELARELQREQAVAAAHAATQERIRIARELHDIVAHHMSVIAVQAGSGRYLALSDPAAGRAALEVIFETSHEALAEMRRILSILRMETAGEDDEAELYAAAPGLDRLAPLVERVRLAGLSVSTSVEGDVRPLAPGLDLCAYRIIQEGLTNVLKHAKAARVEVALRYGPAKLVVRVTDDGAAPPRKAAAGHSATGHGLRGMAERVKLYEGKITAGPLPQGGFEVRAVFPLPAPETQGGDRESLAP
ncbi:histidine kinase [Nonomuraea wenchangensis]